MRITALCILMILLTLKTDNQRDPRPNAEAAPRAVEGAWEVIYVVSRGEEFTGEQIAGNKLAVSGEQMKFTPPPTRGGFIPKKLARNLALVGENWFVLDPSKNPKTIDLTPKKIELEDREKLSKSLGIYCLEGDIFTMCIGGPKTRPNVFESPKGSDFMLIKMKRLKKE